MEKYTIQEILDMSYTEYVTYLLKKYGPVPDNFVLSDGEHFNTKIDRSDEGLVIHHIDETVHDIHPALYDLKRHNRSNLVYCDLLEHLILHVKLFYDPKFNYEHQDDMEIVSDDEVGIEVVDLDPAIFQPEHQFTIFKNYVLDMFLEINRLYEDYEYYNQPGPSRNPALTLKILPKLNSYLVVIKYVLLVTGVGYMEQYGEAERLCTSIGVVAPSLYISHKFTVTKLDYKDTSICL